MLQTNYYVLLYFNNIYNNDVPKVQTKYKLKTVELFMDINDYIKEKHEGMIYCADLLRVNAERGGERKPHCDALVYEMVELVEQILRENGKIQ